MVCRCLWVVGGGWWLEVVAFPFSGEGVFARSKSWGAKLGDTVVLPGALFNGNLVAYKAPVKTYRYLAKTLVFTEYVVNQSNPQTTKNLS